MDRRPKVLLRWMLRALFVVLAATGFLLCFSPQKPQHIPEPILVHSQVPVINLKKSKYPTQKYSSQRTVTPRGKEGLRKAPVLLPLKGGISTHGEYFVDVTLSEGRTQAVRVQVDTGSSSFIVTSKDCVACADGRGGRYSAAISRTSSTVPCHSKECQPYTCAHPQCKSSNHGNSCFSLKDACCSLQQPDSCGFFLEYGGNTEYHVSASGTLVHEIATLAGAKGTSRRENITLYEVEDQAGEWPSNVDGIFGLAFPRLNCNPTCSPMAFEEDMFALCMGDHKGLLLLGGDGSSEHMFVGPLHYVPIVATFMPSYYIVKLEGLTVGETRLGGSSVAHRAIVDSGTTLLLLQEDLWVEFVSVMKSGLCWLPGVCTATEVSIFTPGICLSSLPKRRLPTISLTISGVVLQLPASAYFVKYKTGGQSAYCLGVQSAGAERTVIGDTLLRLYHVVHDKAKMRLGFALANTTTCGELDVGSNFFQIDHQPLPNQGTDLNKVLLVAGGTLFLCAFLSFLIVLAHSYRLLYLA